MTNDALIQAAADAAQGEIDSYLVKRFLVPIDTAVVTGAAEILREKTVDVAVWELAKRRPPVPQHDIDARDRAIAWARDVSKGIADLPDAEVPAPTTTNAPGAEVTSETRQASRTNMAQL